MKGESTVGRASLGDTRGFTLIEVALALILLGILSAVALSHSTSIDAYKRAAEEDRLVTHLRYAQARALDTNTEWGIHFLSGTSYQFFQGDVNTLRLLPGESADTDADGDAYTVTLTAITLTPPGEGVIRFDGFGRPLDANGAPTATNTTLYTYRNRTIVVTAQTGFVDVN